jgi:coenzyme F420-reducing hydrogenase alpha subunit
MFPVECRECEVSVFSRTYKQIFFASTQEMGERVYQMRENVLKLLEVMCDVAFHPDLKQPKQILTEMMGKMMDEFPEVKKTLLKMSKDAKKMVSEKISNEEFEEIVEDSVCSMMNSMQNKALKETADFFADKDRGEA